MDAGHHRLTPSVNFFMTVRSSMQSLHGGERIHSGLIEIPFIDFLRVSHEGGRQHYLP